MQQNQKTDSLKGQCIGIEAVQSRVILQPVKS